MMRSPRRPSLSRVRLLLIDRRSLMILTWKLLKRRVMRLFRSTCRSVRLRRCVLTRLVRSVILYRSLCRNRLFVLVLFVRWRLARTRTIRLVRFTRRTLRALLFLIWWLRSVWLNLLLGSCRPPLNLSWRMIRLTRRSAFVSTRLRRLTSMVVLLVRRSLRTLLNRLLVSRKMSMIVFSASSWRKLEIISGRRLFAC